jgi:hypothetical protein
MLASGHTVVLAAARQQRPCAVEEPGARQPQPIARGIADASR